MVRALEPNVRIEEPSGGYAGITVESEFALLRQRTESSPQQHLVNVTHQEQGSRHTGGFPLTNPND